MSFRCRAAVAAIWRAAVAIAALPFAIAGCSSFDTSLLDAIGASPHEHGGGNDAGQRSNSGEPDASPMPGSGSGPDGSVLHDASANPGFDAGRMQPPGNGDTDAGSDDDAGRNDAGQTACVPTPVDDFCLHVPALPAAAQIDGALDCGPELLALDPQAWNGMSAIPTGHLTKLAVAARPDGLYIYVEVHGQTPVTHPSGSAIYCGDAVELYVDADGTLEAAGNYDNPGTMQFIIAAPGAANSTVEAMRYQQGTDHAAWISDKVKTALLADGYAVETFITAADLDLASWTPTTRIGLDLAIDVSAPTGTPNLRCGQLIGQYFQRVDVQAGSCNHEPWCDSLAFCTPAL